MAQILEKGKIESGTELLARLGPRPSLHGLGAWKLLGFEPSPGDIVELYGEEGTAKTELLLKLVTSALLPRTATSTHNGNKIEVIWVDCDLKFSVMRMAVLLEQCLMNEEHSHSSQNCNNVRETNIENDKLCSSGQTEQENASKRNTQTDTFNQTLSCQQTLSAISTIGQNVFLASHKDTSSDKANINIFEAKTEKSLLNYDTTKRKAEHMDEDHMHSLNKNMCSEKECCDSSQQISFTVNKVATKTMEKTEIESQSEKETENPDREAEEMERRVEECLQRVHVVRCTSSQQLICTLHSLQALIATNPNITLLVIDPISAFYWSDRCSDFHQSSSFLHRNMAHIVSMLNKIASSYGILVMVTKQALVKPKRGEQTSNTVSMSSVTGGEDAHTEFLGQVWSGAVTHRLVCRKCARQNKSVSMKCCVVSGPSGQKHFAVDESGVHGNQSHVSH